MATNRKGIKVYLPDDLAELVQQEVDQDNRTMTAIVTRALRVYYASPPAGGKKAKAPV